MLHAARGLPNARIAERVGVHVDTVRTWRSPASLRVSPPAVAFRRTRGGLLPNPTGDESPPACRAFPRRR
ncbi:hypothetical protein [Streptomyces sp. NPDC058677]|uniref:hypothetical protein n=1 Tax=Streptomyces sp. NPDC058677 TaxID=3346594 RepID=UPI00364A155E